MTSKKQARRALFASFTSLLLCFAMLIGTTFAWFTDVAETGLNQIIAGNLDVELVDETGKKVEGATDLFDEPELWEPGAVAYQQLQVKNVGTLDLKYSMSINYKNVNSLNGHALSEVLKYAIITLPDLAGKTEDEQRQAVLDAAKASTNKGSLNDYQFVGTLDAKAASELQTLVVFWEPNADGVDNLYNANNGQKTSDGNPLQINLGVRVYATQVGGSDHEEDSFGPSYDLNAPTQVLVSSDAKQTVYTSLADAIAEHGASNTFTVSGPITLPATLAGATATIKQLPNSSPAIIAHTGAMNTGNADLTFEGVVIQGKDVNYEGLQHAAKVTYKNCTFLQSQTLYAPTVVFEDCTFYLKDRYIWTYGADDVTFSGCTFNNANSKAILVYQESDSTVCNVTVENCVFNAQAKGYTGTGDWTAAVEIDASLAPAKVAISNSVTDGNYNGIVRVKAGADNVDVTVDGTTALIAHNDASLAAALATIKSNSSYWNIPVTVLLTGAEYSGTYEINQYPEWNGVVGAGSTANNMATGVAGENWTDITFLSTVGSTFTGSVTVNGFGNAGTGFASATTGKTVFDGVAFEGDGSNILLKVKAAANNVAFEDCDFKDSTHITMGGNGADATCAISFTGCTFDNGNCLSGYYQKLDVISCTMTNGYKGFVNTQAGAVVTVDDCTIDCGEYAFRTQNGAANITVTDSTINVFEVDGAQNLVWFRGSGHTAAFTGCTLGTTSFAGPGAANCTGTINP